MYLLDSDTCIAILRRNPDVVKKLKAHAPDQLAIAIPTYYELRIGIHKSADNRVRKEQQLDTLLSYLRIIPFETAEAEMAAQTRALLEQKGTPIGSIDYLIAGTALANNLKLITGNTDEFRRVPKLKLTNWF
ncbi:MAG: type II toxin-antitoxin system VapC family toxin [Verrucomicrobiaceae bacterium]